MPCYEKPLKNGGVNNVIKALKRRSFGFRNMEYFKLKIMQVCGYLNSRYATRESQTSFVTTGSIRENRTAAKPLIF
ncbi:MAG: transposase [Deltaproteobacteria bacterium]|nr:transposase [Deltaproteobacteria bacterium]